MPTSAGWRRVGERPSLKVLDRAAVESCDGRHGSAHSNAVPEGVGREGGVERVAAQAERAQVREQPQVFQLDPCKAR